MARTMAQDYRLRKMTSTEFHTLIEAGWEQEDEEDFGIALVTYEPWLMKYILDHKHFNRPLSPAEQQRLRLALAEDRWRVNGESIIFSNTMQLLDGQNRETAGLEMEKPITSVTVWGVDPEVFDSIDIGKKRSGADMLAAKQIPEYSVTAAALRTYYRLVNKAILTTTVMLPDDQILPYYQAHKKIYYSISHAMKIKRFVPPSLGVALHYLFHTTEGPEGGLADVMYDQLGKGTELQTHDPVYVLRELFVARKEARIKKNLDVKDYAQLAARMINVWNALRKQRRIARTGIPWDDTTAFPEIV